MFCKASGGGGMRVKSRLCSAADGFQLKPNAGLMGTSPGPIFMRSHGLPRKTRIGRFPDGPRVLFSRHEVRPSNHIALSAVVAEIPCRTNCSLPIRSGNQRPKMAPNVKDFSDKANCCPPISTAFLHVQSFHPVSFYSADAVSKAA